MKSPKQKMNKISNCELVQSPIENKLKQVLSAATNSLFIASPYVKDYGVEFVLRYAARVKDLKLLTNLDLNNMCGQGFDIESLPKLWTNFNVYISSLGKMHTKAYIADNNIALLTSANLTQSGLSENYEYGIILNETSVVSGILADMNYYFNLGNIFDQNTIKDIIANIKEVRELQTKIENIELKKLNELLEQKIDDLQIKIFQNRIKGRTINDIFSQTIKYFLETRGPLSTTQLHPFIQNIHPDICNDNIDRIIDGQHFGKKWKHLVRNAQQFLKKNDIIRLEKRKWRLVK